MTDINVLFQLLNEERKKYDAFIKKLYDSLEGGNNESVSIDTAMIKILHRIPSINQNRQINTQEKKLLEIEIQKNQELIKKIKSLTRSNKELEKKLYENEIKSGELFQEKEILVKEMKDLGRKINDKDDEINRKNDLLKKTDTEIRHLLEELEGKDEKISENEKQIQDLRKSINTNANLMISKFKEDNIMLCEEIQNMMKAVLSNLDNSGKQIITKASITADLNNMKVTFFPLLNEYDFVQVNKKNIVLLSGRYQKINQKFVEIIEKINSVKKESKRQLQERFKNIEETNKEVLSKLNEKIESEFPHMIEKVTKIETQVEHLKKETKELEAKKERLTQDLDGLNEKYNTLSEYYKRQTADLTERNNQFDKIERFSDEKSRKVESLKSLILQQMYIAKSENEAQLDFQRELFCKMLKK